MIAGLVVLFPVLNSLLIYLWVGWLWSSWCVLIFMFMHFCVCVCVCVCVFGKMGSDSGALFTHLTEFCLRLHYTSFEAFLCNLCMFKLFSRKCTHLILLTLLVHVYFYM